MLSLLHNSSTKGPPLSSTSALLSQVSSLLPASSTDQIDGVSNKRKMWCEVNRRRTFVNWPHKDYKWAVPDTMAQAGFYHQVRCAICNLHIWNTIFSFIQVPYLLSTCTTNLICLNTWKYQQLGFNGFSSQLVLSKSWKSYEKTWPYSLGDKDLHMHCNFRFYQFPWYWVVWLCDVLCPLLLKWKVVGLYLNTIKLAGS